MNERNRAALENPRVEAVEIPEYPSPVDEAEVVEPLEKEVENLRADNARLAKTLATEREQKELFRRLATFAESNELQLHRKLSGYVDGDVERLRARNDTLEAKLALKENANGAGAKSGTANETV